MWKIMEEFQDFRRRRQSKGKKRLILFFLSLSQGGGALFHFAQSFTSDTSATLWKITWRQKQLETDSFFRLVERERVSHFFFFFSHERKPEGGIYQCVCAYQSDVGELPGQRIFKSIKIKRPDCPIIQLCKCAKKNTHSSLSPRPHVVVVQVGKSLYY
jgi:hypothetical protein